MEQIYKLRKKILITMSLCLTAFIIFVIANMTGQCLKIDPLVVISYAELIVAAGLSSFLIYLFYVMRKLPEYRCTYQMISGFEAALTRGGFKEDETVGKEVYRAKIGRHEIFIIGPKSELTADTIKLPAILRSAYLYIFKEGEMPDSFIESLTPRNSLKVRTVYMNDGRLTYLYERFVFSFAKFGFLEKLLSKVMRLIDEKF